MSIFGTKYFLQFCVPLIAVIGSVCLKFVSRNDAHKAFRKEDLAVGLDLSVTALLLFVAGGSQLTRNFAKAPQDEVLGQKLATLPWIIMLLLFGIWAVSTVVRKLGWEGDGTLNKLWGIIIPDVFGLAALLSAVSWI